MLDQLQISNLALIDHLTLSFSKGLNILSGETGAGKSIIIKAVNLLLGEKPSPDSIRQGAAEASLEALFTIPADHPLQPFFQSLGLPADDQILIRRLIQPAGKSRAWINGSLVSQTVLGRLGRTLLSISNQHEHQALLDPGHHLLLLDLFGGLHPLREETAQRFQALEGLVKSLALLLDTEQKRKAQTDLWTFQAQEIRQAGLHPGEDQELLQRKKILQQAERIWEKIHQAQQVLSEEEHSCLMTLSRSKELIKSAGRIDPALNAQMQELEQAELHLRELDLGLRDYLQQITFDPQELERLEERLLILQRLIAKYGPTTADVLSCLKEIEQNLQQGEDTIQQKIALEQSIEKERRGLVEISLELSEQRKKAARRLAKGVEEELKELGLAGCRFEVVFTLPPTEGKTPGPFDQDGRRLTPEGLEQGEFYIAPNPGEGLRPMARIASGGELSRILLVLKGLLSQQGSVETLIFDEVDSGIGGSLGEAVGKKLKKLARFHQILCITHLPQIAAFAETHYQVAKKTVQKRTLTEIHPLQGEARVKELARMLGGDQTSGKTFSLAKELLDKAKSNTI